MTSDRLTVYHSPMKVLKRMTAFWKVRMLQYWENAMTKAVILF